jgi:uncharacterized cupin superfamily protein
MPVIRSSVHALDADHRPPWCTVTSAGIFRVPAAGGRFDCHFHDCDEYWLVFGGKAKVRTEGEEFYVAKGDIVCTKAGDEHDVLEVYEDLEAFWFEGETPADGRVGHLHHDVESSRGHDVPYRPLPDDFPACP